MGFGGHPDVRDRQNREHQGLHDAYDGAERVKRERNHELGEAREERQHLVIGEHIGEETNTEREGPEKIVGQLNEDKEPREPPNGSEEAQQVARPLMAKTLHNIENEGDDTEGEGQIGIVGRRLHPGNQAEEVGGEDENKEAAEERNEVARLVHFGDAGDEAIKPFDQDFGKAAQSDTAIGNQGIRGVLEGLSGRIGEDEKESHHEPGAENHGRQVEASGEDVDEVNWMQRGAAPPKIS
jgi:hypothetical protein